MVRLTLAGLAEAELDHVEAVAADIAPGQSLGLAIARLASGGQGGERTIMI